MSSYQKYNSAQDLGMKLIGPLRYGQPFCLYSRFEESNTSNKPSSLPKINAKRRFLSTPSNRPSVKEDMHVVLEQQIISSLELVLTGGTLKILIDSNFGTYCKIKDGVDTANQLKVIELPTVSEDDRDLDYNYRASKIHMAVVDSSQSDVILLISLRDKSLVDIGKKPSDLKELRRAIEGSDLPYLEFE